MQPFLQRKRLTFLPVAVLVSFFYLLYSNQAFSQRGVETRRADGKGGTITTITAHDVELVEFNDANKVRRKLEILPTFPGTVGAARKDVNIYYDCHGQKIDFSGITYDHGGHEIQAQEEKFSGGKAISGIAYTWELGQGMKLTYNYDPGEKKFITSGSDINWETFKPDLSLCPKIDYSGLIKPLFPYKLTGDEHYTATEPETEYTGGKEMVDAFKGLVVPGHENYEVVDKKTYDAHGVLRHEVYREYYEDGCEYEEVSYYDCHGEPLYEDYTWYDDDGYDYEFEGHYYKDGKLWAGYYYYDGYSGDEEHYDAATNQWEYKWSPGMNQPDDYKPDTSDCPDAETYWNPYFYLGPSLIREDNGSNHFNTYGVEFSYTHFCCYRGGLTGDLGVNFGSDFGTNYTKVTGLAGGLYMPIKTATLRNDFDFSVRAMIGVTYLNAKYSSGNYSSSSSNTSFTGDAGLGFDYKINKSFGLGVRLDYMPVFNKGNTAGNIRLGVGVDF